eukprot:XP_001704276.1 Hypothetical protein GL50803_28529 [Giardia lamblia ATCC 50803]
MLLNNVEWRNSLAASVGATAGVGAWIDNYASRHTAAAQCRYDEDLWGA